MAELKYYEDRSLAECRECGEYHNIKWVKSGVCKAGYENSKGKRNQYKPSGVLGVIGKLLGMPAGAAVVGALLTIPIFPSSSGESTDITIALNGVLGGVVIVALALFIKPLRQRYFQWVDQGIERAQERRMEKLEMDDPATAKLIRRGDEIAAQPDESD